MSAQKPSMFKLFFVILLGAVITYWYWYIHQQQDTTTTNIVPITQKNQTKTIDYDVDNWQLPAKNKNIESILSMAGVGAIADTGLDFDGLPANIYRYHNRHDSPFFVAISDNYIEIAWYFASSNNNTQQKTLSLDYAKKAHTMTAMMIGSEATPLFKKILDGKKTTANGVALAECKNYECRIVLFR